MFNMKVSRLLWENDPDYIKSLFENGQMSIQNDRCMGTSTGICFKIISEAMLNPRKEIKIKEYGNYQQDRHLFGMLQDILVKLNLKGFTLRHADMTLIYNPYVELKVTVTLSEV